MLFYENELIAFMRDNPNTKILVVGSSAMELHGYPVDNQDIDIVVDTDIDNIDISKYPHLDIGGIDSKYSRFKYMLDSKEYRVKKGNYFILSLRGLKEFYKELFKLYIGKSYKALKYRKRLFMLEGIN